MPVSARLILTVYKEHSLSVWSEAMLHERLLWVVAVGGVEEAEKVDQNHSHHCILNVASVPNMGLVHVLCNL